ncbi:MAG: hypothetical protein JKY44_10395, partial [Flavobacteriaceae bacterium]|nr:hypothetical protein [Flavobacteriaceae bacterium]
MKTIIACLLAFSISIASAFSQDISGDWNGKTKKGNKEITFGFQIKKENNSYSSTMSVPTFRI